MMKKRDTVAIQSVGEYLLTSIEELKTEKNNLNTHIEEILNNYKGVDADVITSKFFEASSKIDFMVLVIEYYGKYMNMLSNHDKENIETASKDIQAELNTPLLGDNSNSSNLSNITLESDVIENV